MSSSPRWLIAEFKHETNTFSSKKTGIEHYRARYLKYEDEIIPFFTDVRVELGGFIDGAKECGAEIVPVVAANAMPAGPVTRDMFEHVLHKVSRAVQTSGRLDGILLSLHGAMVVEDSFDGEGEFLERLREVAPDTPIMITLDFHANMTERMVRNCDAIFGYNTYPHIDMYERALEAARNMANLMKKEIRPVMALKSIPMLIPSLETASKPFKDVFDLVFEIEHDPRVINVCWFQGFPWTDIPYAASSVVVITNGDQELAEQIAAKIAKKVWDMREQFVVDVLTTEDAISRALASDARPFVFADVSDNPGGGAPGDGTQVLASLIKAGVKNAAFAIVYDPAVVQQAAEQGPGAVIRTSLGGKTEPEHLHGAPLNVEAVVKTLSDGCYVNKGPMSTGLRADIGRTAVLDIAGIQVIVPERRIQPTDPEIFRRHGIEPLDTKILVVKSSLHYRAGFGPLAHEIIQLDVPGLTSPNFGSYTYKNLKRPVWPLD